MLPSFIDVLILELGKKDKRIERRIIRRLDGVYVHSSPEIGEVREIIGSRTVNILLVDMNGLPRPRENQYASGVDKGGGGPCISSPREGVLRLLDDDLVDYVYCYEIHDDAVVDAIRRSLSRRRRRGCKQLSVYCVIRTSLAGVIGDSPPIHRMAAMIRRVARTGRPVLITGPTGSGKSLAAQAIHDLSAFAQGPFLDVNCGAIPDSLIESHLFGFEKGSFTGADQRREGYLEAADQGTLFLDEVAELPYPTQTKLLQVLESGVYRRLGSNKNRLFKGRIVAATHADLAKRVKNRSFREDLYYRLNVFTIDAPSLNERRSDIPALVNHFAKDQHRPLFFTDDAMNALMQADWPGNIRQLRNIIDRVAVLSDDEPVTSRTISQFLNSGQSPKQDVLDEIARTILRLRVSNKLTAIESALINRALLETAGNKSEAARLLGVHRKVVERRIKSLEPRPDQILSYHISRAQCAKAAH